METYFVHIIESSVCLAVFYVSYLLFFRKENGFKFIRYYLLASLVISVLLPFNNFPIRFSNSIATIENTEPITVDSKFPEENFINHDNRLTSRQQPIDYYLIVKWIYWIGFAFILLRFIIGLLTIFLYNKQSLKDIRGNIVILKNEKLNRSFSFLNLVFINPIGLTENEIKGVIAHENIHVSQYHTIDLILIELLSAVMWFNPFVWLMRKSLRQVHEYLADEGVLNIGFDRLEYQTLLINQVAESRLVSLASSFNQSQIKKRILMMTKIKSGNMTKLKLFALIPVSAILFLTISCVYGQNKNNVVTAVEPVRMNVLYIGVDNPIKIAASGYEASELEVSIDNGIISGKNGEYVIQPKEKGSANVTIKCNGKEIQKTNFRVKYVPDPVAKVYGKKAGPIKMQELLKVDEVVADLENFDFDLSFDIVEFRVSAIIDGFTKESKSNSNLLTEEQKEIISKLKDGSRITFDDIKCKGPDGTLRNLQAIVLKIVE